MRVAASYLRVFGIAARGKSLRLRSGRSALRSTVFISRRRGTVDQNSNAAFALLRMTGRIDSSNLREPELAAQEQVGGDEQEEDYRDHTVHSEKGGVQLGQVCRRDEGVLVGQKERDGEDSSDR